MDEKELDDLRASIERLKAPQLEIERMHRKAADYAKVVEAAAAWTSWIVFAIIAIAAIGWRFLSD